MSRSRISFRVVFFILLAGLLQACDTDKMQETENGIQQNLFLQSVELVESAGNILQSPALTEQDIEKAMSQMDQGLEQAFQVKSDFLKKLDTRLPKLYRDAFVSGVQSYRLGVEASDREKQEKGLDLLSQWGQFWLKERAKIQQKLQSING
jgi:hypothetical protein